MTQGTAWAAGLLAAGVCAAPDAGDEGPNASKAPRFTFPQTLEGQEAALAENPLLEPFRESRAAMAGDPHRPVYHYVNPEHVLNDPNGLCSWQGRWRLFYQAYPPEDPRQHWGHAVSDDLFHWRDLPYAIHPGPERMCFSGATFVEEDRVIALYHGVGAGTMAAVSSDPLLLTWDKVAGGPVIPEPKPGESLPYNVFDPCVWKQGGRYYALTAGSKPGPGGKSVRAEFLHRSSDLAEWQYLSRASAWRNRGATVMGTIASSTSRARAHGGTPGLPQPPLRTLRTLTASKGVAP